MSSESRTILLLEDNEGLVRSMKRVLELEGYRVLHAPDAHAARTAFEEEPRIDLLFADLVLPGLSGREAANLILAHHPEVKVLFTSGFASAELDLKDLGSEGFPVLRKPYEVPALLEAIRSALDS